MQVIGHADGPVSAGGTDNAIQARARADRLAAIVETDGLGGAIFNDAGSELILDQVSILENEAGLRGVMEFGGFGGGIYNDASNGQRGVLTISNSAIRRNGSPPPASIT